MLRVSSLNQEWTSSSTSAQSSEWSGVSTKPSSDTFME